MKLQKTLMALATAAAIAAPLSARADVSLCLDDGAGGLAAMCVNDGGLGDVNPLAGAITFLGNYGTFFLNVSTAIGEPLYLNGYGMDLNSVNVGIGTLVLSMSQNNMQHGSGGPITIAGAIGGVTGGQASYEVFADDSNALFGQGTKIFEGTSNGWGLFGGGSGTFQSTDGTFSLTNVVTIVHKDWANTSFNFESKVPEPASLALMGIGLLGIGAARRRGATKR